MTWVTFSLEELGKVVTGTTPPGTRPDYFAPIGVPFLTPTDMSFDTRSVTTARYLSSEGVDYLRSRLLPKSSISVVCIGSTIGKACFTSATTVSNQQINTLIPNPSTLHPLFGYYALVVLGRDFKRIAGGSTSPIINATTFKQQRIPIPPLSEQRAIAATLGALDDKIESNRKLADLIPDLIHSLVERELVAKGAFLTPVSALGDFVNGGAYTKGASGTGRMVIRIADLNSGPGASTVYNDIAVPEDRVARPGDILMSWSGSLGVYVWHRPEAIVNQHIFKVIPNGIPHWLVFDRLGAVIDSFRGIAADKATTMGHIQRAHLTTTTVALPEPGIDDLDRACGPLWERRNLLMQESLRLADLRDSLLPELMSGRIRVREASEAVEQEVG